MAPGLDPVTTRFNTLAVGGESLALTTGGDADLTVTHVTVEGDFLTDVGERLTLGGASDSTMSGWLSQDRVTLGKATDLERSTTVTSRVQESRIDAGGRMVLRAGSVELGAVEIDAGGGTRFDSKAIDFVIETDEDFHQFEQKDNDWSYTITSDQGSITQSAHWAHIAGDVDFGGTTPTVQVAVGEADTTRFSQEELRSRFAEQATDPGQGWMASLAAEPTTQFQAVNTAEQSWDIDNQALTQEGMIVGTVAIAVATWGAGSSVAGTSTAATSGGTATTAGAVALSTTTAAGVTTYTAAGAALNAAFTSLVTTSAVSFANSGGDVGAVFDSLGSEETWKQTLVAAGTAGLLHAQIWPDGAEGSISINQMAGITRIPGSERLASGGLEDLAGHSVGYFARGVVNAGVSTLVYGSEGGSFVDLFRDSIVLDLSAAGANQIGTTFGRGGTQANPALQTLAHAGLGCASAVARNADCAAGALGGAAESVVGNAFAALGGSIDPNNAYTSSAYQVGNELFARGLAWELGLDQETAQGAAGNSARNNFLAHSEATRRADLEEQKRGCHGDRDCIADLQVEIDAINYVDRERDVVTDMACRDPQSSACGHWIGELQIASASYDGARLYGAPPSIVAERQSADDQLYMYQTRAEAPFRYGVGKGVVNLTPPGMIYWTGYGLSSLSSSVIERGWMTTFGNMADGLIALPGHLINGVQSDNAAVQGESIVNAVAFVGGVAYAGNWVRTTGIPAIRTQLAG